MVGLDGLVGWVGWLDVDGLFGRSNAWHGRQVVDTVTFPVTVVSLRTTIPPNYASPNNGSNWRR
jgi:hypothetical protein